MKPTASRYAAIALAISLLLGATAAEASDKGALDEIFANWFTGQAGFGSATAIASYETQETMDLGAKGARATNLAVLRTFPGHFRFEFSEKGAEPIVQAFDGRIGWQARGNSGLGPLSHVDSDIWFLQNDLLFALRAFRPPLTYRPLARMVVNGHVCIGAAVVDVLKIEGKCYFDRKTHQLISLERSLGPGTAAKVVAEFDDFRSVGALTIPFTMKVSLGDAVTIHHRSNITINPPVDEASFILSTAQLQNLLSLDSVLKQHDSSIGAAEDLALLRSRVTHLSLEVSTTGTRSEETISQQLPNRILVETETPGMGRDVKGYDGSTGWCNNELQGYRPLKPAELAQLINEGAIHLVGRLREAFPFRRRVGERDINGRLAIGVALANRQRIAGTFYFDKENSRLLRVALPVTGDRENSTESTVDFTDFRRIGGMEIPFVLVQTNPLTRTVSTVQSVQNNAPLDDEIFHPHRDE